MERRSLAVALVIVLLALLIHSMRVYADSESINPYGEPYKIRCTCYTAPDGAITYSGKKVREGIVAGRTEDLDCVAVLYSCDEDGELGEFIGFFEVLDTGGKAIRQGKRVDVFRDTLERCNEWVDTYGDYVYIQLIPAVG